MTQQIAELVDVIGAEFECVNLGDARREARLKRMVERIATSPAESFPKVMASVAEREATYRFFNNDAVHWEDILEPHIIATVARASGHGVTRIVHDTTDFVFSGDRDDMGPVMQNTHGFFAHMAMAVSGAEERVPLGVVGLTAYTRTARKKKKTLNQRKLDARKTPRSDKESCRWEELAKETSARFPRNDVIHVMDQEADDFVLLAELQRAELRFVVRGSSDRLLSRTGPSVQSEMEARDDVVFRDVPLSARPAHRSPKARKAHPPRQERTATLHLRWAPLTLAKPQHAQTDVPSLALWVVQVFEPEPPPGETAISWTLFTSEPAVDLASATAVVDHYRARWRIEEYFRALKQGCAFQDRQLESLDALLNVLATFIPIGWRLLLLRSIGQADVALPATHLLHEDELDVLRALLAHKKCRPLPKAPTVRDAMLAIANTGGHIPANGPPGWIVLGRGYEDVLQATIIWRAARKALTAPKGRKK